MRGPEQRIHAFIFAGYIPEDSGPVERLALASPRFRRKEGTSSMATPKTIPEKVAELARGELNKPARKWRPGRKGKCEELVNFVLDQVGADMGLEVAVPQVGDLAVFKNHTAVVTVEVFAYPSGEDATRILRISLPSRRRNHIGIISSAPDTSRKVFLIEQNVGGSEKVIQSPIYTNGKVSHKKYIPQAVPFSRFRKEFIALIKDEYPRHRAKDALKVPDWKDLKLWLKASPRGFRITVSHSDTGSIKFFRPEAK